MSIQAEANARLDALRSGDSELATLRAKLAARENKPGYSDSVNDIKARIAELTEAAGADQESTS